MDWQLSRDLLLTLFLIGIISCKICSNFNDNNDTTPYDLLIMGVAALNVVRLVFRVIGREQDVVEAKEEMFGWKGI